MATRTKDAPLYGAPRPKKPAGKPITASSSLAFTSALSTLLAASSTTTAGTGTGTAPGARPRKPRPASKDDIFTAHNRNAKKRAAADLHSHCAASTRLEGGPMDEAAWRRTKRKMEDKARLYAAMKRGDVEDENERHMVDFDRKWMEAEDGQEAPASSSSEDDSGGGEAEEEQVEYEDEFGRTRTGTRGEAARELRRRETGKRHLDEADRYAARPAAPSNIIYGDAVQAEAFNPDEPVAAQMERLAAKRDRELTPPDAVHYDAEWEVRTKGTAFFHFSKDEGERQAQMCELERERAETELLRSRKSLAGRREERRRAVDARAQLLRERRDAKQADRFLDDLGTELDTGLEPEPEPASEA